MRAGETPAWTLIIVPPKLTSSTRRVGLKMRTLRMFGMLMTAVFAVSWLWVTTQSDTAAMMADQLAEEQRAMIALHDTVQSLRTASYAEHARNLPPVDMSMPVNGEITSRFSRSPRAFNRVSVPYFWKPMRSTCLEVPCAMAGAERPRAAADRASQAAKWEKARRVGVLMS